MKFFTALVAAALLQAGNSYAEQLVKITKERMTIREILEEIRIQTGREYIFHNQLSTPIKAGPAILPYDKLLDKVLKGTRFAWELSGDIIKIIPGKVSGHVINEKGERLAGITVTIKGSSRIAATDGQGYFSFPEAALYDSLECTSINMDTVKVKIEGKTPLLITMKSKTDALKETVIATNGYEEIPRERATGSFTLINHETLHKQLSTGLLERLEGQAPGVMNTRNPRKEANEPPLSVRGRSTIFSLTDPLLIFDEFPYGTDINDINPHDIESISINKDAAATSIWGAAAGNGAIVITPQKGRYRQAPTVSVFTGLLFTMKPDAPFPRTSSPGLIALEGSLFDAGFYDPLLANPSGLVSPAVEIMNKRRKGVLTKDATQKALDELGQYNALDEYRRLFYQPSLLQQYWMSFSGGGSCYHYWISGGYDHNNLNRPNAAYQRWTGTTYIAVKPVPKLELSFSAGFLNTIHLNDMASPALLYPYVRLVDGDGHAGIVPYGHRQSWKDSMEAHPIEDWSYRPLDELYLQQNKTTITNWRLKFAATYRLWKPLEIKIAVQSHQEKGKHLNLHSAAGYFTRDQYNTFTEIQAGTLSYHLPYGDILDRIVRDYQGINTRIHFRYTDSFNHRFKLTALAGAETREVVTDSAAGTFYGYRNERDQNDQISFDKDYPLLYNTGIKGRIPNNKYSSIYYDRFASLYANAAITYKDRYTVSASGRIDQSNLFGAGTNQKGIPLWSTGIRWMMNRERFYPLRWLPELTLRASYGCNGNVNKNVTAYLTSQPNGVGSASGSLITPPNQHLRWEKINLLNVAVDFQLGNRRLVGTVEYYKRWSQFLLGDTPLESTTGFTMYRANTAALTAKGVEVSLASRNTTGLLKWSTLLIFSYTAHTVTRYHYLPAEARAYTDPARITPRPGYSLDEVFAYRWRGLDSLNGHPLGEVEGNPSAAYPGILKANPATLVPMGPSAPPFSGSLQNSVQYKDLTLSCMLTGKFGHVFRKPVPQYTDLYTSKAMIHPDFSLRWQHPGDETRTTVPSAPAFPDPQRDQFYANAEVNVEKAAHIRLQQLQLSYKCSRKLMKSIGARNGSFTISAYNLGILLKATDTNIDPDYVNGLRPPAGFAISFKIDL